MRKGHWERREKGPNFAWGSRGVAQGGEPEPPSPPGTQEGERSRRDAGPQVTMASCLEAFKGVT